MGNQDEKVPESFGASDARQLSFLMDGELGAGEAGRLLAEMSADNRLSGSWQSYHLIRQGLRGESALLADEGFAGRVARQLAGEPVHPCPIDRREWLKPAAGLALAAAVSAVAVWGMRGEQGVDGMRNLPDSLVASGASQQAGNGFLSPEKLNEYLVMHSEGVYQSGAGDMLPQSRVVSIVNP